MKATPKAASKATPDATHEDYKDMVATWKKCRDAATGQRAIHKGGEAYLPKLSGQSPTDYAAYKARALYYNATGRTVEGMAGLVFRKKYVCTVPAAMEPWLGDVTLTEQGLEGFARELVEDIIKVGRGGILVDHPPAPKTDAPLTVGQAATQGHRPYLVNYKAEAIINWRRAKLGTAWRLADVWLKSDTYESGKTVEQILQLTLASGFYEQVFWRKDAKGEWFEFDRVQPLKDSAPIKDIPFFFCGAQELGCEVQEPPIEDLVYVNLALYQNSADYEKSLHMAGNPQAWITGLTQDEGDDELQVGSDTAWVLPNVESKVGYLTLQADGLTALEKAMIEKKADMAALGARMLAPEKKAAETAETAVIRRSGENSVLASIAGSVSAVIDKSLKFMADWAGLDVADTAFELNRDFVMMQITPQMLTAIVAAWQGGAISDQTKFNVFKAGEIIDETVTFEDEQEEIAKGGPPEPVDDPNDSE